MLKFLKEQADRRGGRPEGAATADDINSSADRRGGGNAGSEDRRGGGNAGSEDRRGGGNAGSEDRRGGGAASITPNIVFNCLLNSNTKTKIVKTGSPRQVRQVFSDASYYFFSNYYFQMTDKDGKFDKTRHYTGTWKCDGDKDYIINTEDGDEYSSKTGKWKGVPDSNSNSNSNSNTNNNNNSGGGTSLVDTTLTADDLKAGKFVKKGMKGKIVGDIQNLLIKLGYTDVSKSGKADDKFGSRTEKMVKDFQKANGLTDDGSVGEKTWPKLNDPAAVKNSGSSSSSSTSALGSAQANVPQDGETTAGTDAIIIKESLRKTLRKNLLKFN
jgi:hypothetical protein